MTSLATLRLRAPANRDLPPSTAARSGARRPRWFDIRSRAAYRRGIGRVLSKGPLFQPESGSEIEAASYAAQLSRLRGQHVMSTSRQPGWIFVCTDENHPASVRLGIAEADDRELRHLNANRRVSRDLRIRQAEVLRYSVFTNNVHSALRSVEAYLKEFRTIDDRYRVHSAAAATAIETCGVYLHSRRSNFEPIEQPDSDGGAHPFIDENDTQFDSEADCDDDDLDLESTRDSRRGAQRQQLASVVSEVGHSIALASEALQNSGRSQTVAATDTFQEHRGLLRPDSRSTGSHTNPHEQISLSTTDIASMEKWVMRREAIEYMKLRRLQFAQTTVTAAFLGAVGGLGVYIYSDAIAHKFHLGLLIVSLSISAATLVAVMFWFRYRKGLIVWRRILKNCADASLPEVRPRRI